MPVAARAPTATSKAHTAATVPVTQAAPARSSFSRMPGYLAKAPPALKLGGVGEPLSTSVRGRLESSLGLDLGLVRIHSDAAANAAAAGMQARAFTTGHHIFLGRGESASDLE